MAKEKDNSIFLSSAYQRGLWDNQYIYRAEHFGLDEPLKFVPNQSGVLFNDLLPGNALILEIGSGNGRDARFWALGGHSVVCLDFSKIGLAQLLVLAEKQDIRKNLLPVLCDINDGVLPFTKIPVFDGVYARSSLHVNDNVMLRLVNEINALLKSGSQILISGRTVDDTKIERSIKLLNGLSIDISEAGHLRRIWTKEYIEEMCRSVGWSIVEISNHTETMNNKEANYITLIAKK